MLAAAGLAVLHEISDDGDDTAVCAQAAKDNANAAALAAAINSEGQEQAHEDKAGHKGATSGWLVRVDPLPETNIIIMSCGDGVDAGDMVREMETRGVLAFPLSGHTVRLVTHLEVEASHVPLIGRAIGAAARAARAARAAAGSPSETTAGGYGDWNTN